MAPANNLTDKSDEFEDPLEKPAIGEFYPWLIAAISLPQGDVNEFYARVFSALAALGTFLLTFYLGHGIYSGVPALYCARADLQ